MLHLSSHLARPHGPQKHPVLTAEDVLLFSSDSSTSCCLAQENTSGEDCTIATRQYHVQAECSFDSLASEETLACDELLLSEPPAKRQCLAHNATATRNCSTPLHVPGDLGSGEVHATIWNEVVREREIAAASGYLERHADINHETRNTVLAWMVEVCVALRLRQETLFLAASYLDRFMTLSKSVPRLALQLLALACLSLASKQEEVQQSTAREWAELLVQCRCATPCASTCVHADLNVATHAHNVNQVEWLVMDTLGWRLRTPTPYTFLHLYFYGLGDCDVLTICMSSYAVELALLELHMLNFSYSMLAAGALVVGHLVCARPLDVGRLLALAPHLQQAEVAAAASCLITLLHSCCSSDAHLLAPVVQKYRSEAWCSVGHVHITDEVFAVLQAHVTAALH